MEISLRWAGRPFPLATGIQAFSSAVRWFYLFTLAVLTCTHRPFGKAQGCSVGEAACRQWRRSDRGDLPVWPISEMPPTGLMDICFRGETDAAREWRVVAF